MRAAAAQTASTLSPVDPAYEDLARLEIFGLVPRGLAASRPLSVSRVAWIASEARAWLRTGSPRGEAVRRDLIATLDRLDARFNDPDRTASLLVAGELGGGASPGHGIPSNGVGTVDADLNPLWSYRAGRAYGDRATAAAAGRASVGIGPHLALTLGGRASALRSTGDDPVPAGATVEAMALRAKVGRWALHVGRDALTWSGGPRGGLLLSQNAPPIDAIRLTTDRPLALHLLGDTELDLWAADLGPNQNFPHARLFGARASSRPLPSLRMGLALLNKQGGEGSPQASLGTRLKDLSFVWDLFRSDDYTFSDKMMAVDAVLLLPARGLRLSAEAAVTDFDHRRLQDTFVDDAAYAVGLELGRLGGSQRHTVALEGRYSGAVMYRHHQFTSGAALNGTLLGSSLGPDGRSASASYRYEAPAEGWQVALSVTVEARSVDPFKGWTSPQDPIARIGDLPDETRRRLEAAWRRSLPDGSGVLELSAGLGRVSNYAYEEGRDRTNAALLLRLWWYLR